MSRERYEEKAGMSPTQRKACVVLALCALAIVLSIVVAWVLPGTIASAHSASTIVYWL